ncbi:hypothetical protein VKT23_012542 [Stygiomarasmius scandens]|uniref:RNI-like protein n=1 Tax=Marasmiellus scandens TaxID=2682957 RepID=A0ABR1JAV4_9AGAR
MSSSSLSSSSSPSSSAVTIPIPGKSILKKPPPPQQGLFSRITRFLPNQNQNLPSEEKALKRAHFILPSIAVVYPISNINPPSTPTLKDEKRAIEEREHERRKRVVRNAADPNALWTLDKVESFYQECCAGCDERPDPAISAAFKSARPVDPITVDFSGVQLTPVSAGILADVFTIEWGLRKVVFKECDLDEYTLKPILHSLLIPDSIHFISLASNKKLKLPSFRLISAFVQKSSSIQFLDLSQIPLDKKAIEVLVAALTPAGHPGLASLRLDDCALKPGALEVLAKVVRTSSLKNISLRYNKINHAGAIALSVMIRDYPDAVPGPAVGLISSSGGSTPTLVPSSPRGGAGSPTSSSLSTSPASSVVNLPATSTTQPPPPPPPRHPATQSHPPPASAAMATTYTPYVPRSRRAATGPSIMTGSSHSAPVHGSQQNSVPIIKTSSQGGVTTVTSPPHHPPPVNGRFGSANNGLSSFQKKLNASLSGMGITLNSTSPTSSTSTSSSLSATPVSSPITTHHPHSSLHTASHSHPPPPYTPKAQKIQSQVQQQPPLPSSSLALLDKVRALDSLPRLGSLRTLDLRGNDLRHIGVGYIGQVLKRNRTLKVLNLSENKIDPQGLVVIAEGLKYNGCLETLDLSRNPLGGGSGITNQVGQGGGQGGQVNGVVGGVGRDKDLEGIHALRTSFTLNTSLKRLFLSSCNLTSASAICLAEFLPESRSLLHLDLTGNSLGVAGVMALAQGLKKNGVVRCLDLEVPPGDEGYARLCREILNTCIRNTEEAERVAQEAEEARAAEAETADGDEDTVVSTTTSTTTSTPATGNGTPVSGVFPSSISGSVSGAAATSGTTVPALSTKSSLSSISTTASQASKSTATSSTTSGASNPQTTPAKKQKSKALWGMIEDSELAKAIGLQDALADAMRSQSQSPSSNVTPGAGLGDMLGLGEKDKDVVVRARRGIRLMKEVVEKGGFRGVLPSESTTPVPEEETSTGETSLFSPSPFSPGPGTTPASSLSWTYTPSRAPTPLPSTPEELIKSIKGVVEEMTGVIERVVEGVAAAASEVGQGVRVEELLDINDEMMSLLGKVEGLLVLENERKEKEAKELAEVKEKDASPTPTSELESESGQKEKPRPSLKLQGLGIRLDPVSESGEKSEEEKEKEDKVRQVMVNGYLSPHVAIASSSSSSSSSSPMSSAYGTPSHDADNSEDEFPLPRVDKGKGRAPPEPVQHEPVLSPTSVLMMSAVQQEPDEEDEHDEDPRFPRYWDDEGGGEAEDDNEEEVENEQTERSKIWVQEEGEVFRKGNILLGPEEMEGEYAGEELRRELLEAMVERPAPRALTDEFGNDILTAEPIPDIFASSPSAEPLSSPRLSLPPSSPLTGTTPVGTPSSENPPTPTPRPYIPRTRSASNSSSIMSLVSPSEGSPVIGTSLTPVLEGEAGVMASSPVSSGPTTPRPYMSRKRSTSSLESQKQ